MDAIAELMNELRETYESLKRVSDVLERLSQQSYKRGAGRHGMSKMTDGPKMRRDGLRDQASILKDELRELGVAEEDIPKDQKAQSVFRMPTFVMPSRF